MEGGDDTTELATLPQSIPGYEFLRQLGQGGMARVYLAREVSLDRLVAIKVMSEGLLSKEFINRFGIEAKTAAQFRHPNIVVVHASGQAAELPYIVFEYIAGGDLEHRLDAEGALTETSAVDIAAKISSALVYLHQRSVIHRDIKPGNILFNAEGDPILADFGIAMDLESDARLTRAGTVIGSPRYMSPEQLRADTVTAKTDMYSLGLVFLEMLGGKLPPGREPAEFLSRAGRYKSLVADLLSDSPEKRPTAEQCLSRLQPGLELGARGRSTSGWIWPASALAAALLVAFLGWNGGGWLQADAVEIKVTPAQAKLYLNGELLIDRRIRVGNASKELVAVAPGFVGASARLSASTAVTNEIVLEPLGVPSAQQFFEFHEVFDDVSLSVAELKGTTIGYLPFDQLLQLRAAIVSDPADAGDSLAALAARADLGDAAAQVGAFLLASEGLADYESARTNLWLNTASARGGYALASFYRALHFREQQLAIGSFKAPEIVEYQNLLRLSRTQGLPFGTDELRSINSAIE